MNYTYLPSTPFRQTPTIIMTSNPSSKKTTNLETNPRVSLLVHDWVSHRPPRRPSNAGREGSPAAQRSQSGLAQMLMNINTSALSRISATINGDAQIVQIGSEEEKWCKDMHLQNNTFEGSDQESAGILSSSPGQQASGDGGRGCYIEGDMVRVVVVTIRDGRVSDWKGGVQDWAISGTDSETERMVNGV